MYSAFMQYKEVLVTGGTGPLGRYVCPSLIGHGFLPRLFVRLGSELSWTVFRPAPWYDLRDGTPRVSTTYLEALAGAIADSVRRQDTVGRVYEDASTDRFPWQELSQLRGHPPPNH
jgi:hypothetical protein